MYWYKVILLFAMALISIWLVVSGIGGALNDNSDELFSDTPELNLGEVPEGSHAGEFIIHNRSNSRIKVTEVTKSCSCDTAKIRTWIDPNSTSSLTYEYNTVGLAGKTSANITVHYHVEDQPDVIQFLKLKVSANIKPEYVFSSRGVTFHEGKPSTKEIRLHPRNDTNVKLTSVFSSCNGIQATLIDGHTARVEFAGGPSYPEDRTGKIVFSTSNETRPKHSVSFRILSLNR